MKFICILSLLVLNIFLSACATPKLATVSTGHQECVVLLHGLARTSRSMVRLEKALAAESYEVLNLGYPSTRYPVEVLADDYLYPALQSFCKGREGVIHFVTHSLGGLVLRQYLKTHDFGSLGKVVMLSPPNQGTEVVDILGENIFFKWIYGPAGQQLHTEDTGLPKQLGSADFTLGIITGNRSINPILSTMIPGEDDGKVGVENAKLLGMSDFLVVPYSHTFIMRKQAVIEQIIGFLETGRFQSVSRH